ncbi:MAG: type II secretion system F family protein [Pseudomonadota bacterium]|nr:type II secretion system F family protein [Pseudomonadota bacterium]
MRILEWLIPALAFGAVFIAVIGVVALLSGGERKRMRERMRHVAATEDEEAPVSLLREQYLRDLLPIERILESLPGMSRIENLTEQTGRRVPAYRIVLLSLALAVVAAMVGLLISGLGLALLAFAIVLPLPYAKLVKDRDERMQQFDEDLPDALDVMSRSLRAGTPFSETLRVVAQEMTDPVATEFGIVFSDINYGVGVKPAFLAALERVPNISLAAVVTAVLVQREAGGNLAEILDRVAKTLRQRHRFKRRLRTLTAEGRMSAWILILMPFILALVLAFTSPGYMPMLYGDPTGLKLIGGALLAMSLGVLWIRKIIHIRY